VCGPTCKERKKIWKEELSSLTTLVSSVATLLTVIAPSKGAGFLDKQNGCLEKDCNVDYGWMTIRAGTCTVLAGRGFHCIWNPSPLRMSHP
jgi:hypothetical protein